MSSYCVVKRNKSATKLQKKCRVMIFVLILIAIAFYVIFTLYRKSMMPDLIKIANAQIQSDSVAIVNKAVCSSLCEIDCKDLLNIQYNDGNISCITANSTIVNALALNTSIRVQKSLAKLSNKVISVPIGTLSGVPLLAGQGANVNITISPISRVTCDFYSTFDSVGINQTLHRMFVKVNYSIDVVIPTCTTVFENTTPILISETLIVGQIPNYYANNIFEMGGNGK